MNKWQETWEDDENEQSEDFANLLKYVFLFSMFIKPTNIIDMRRRKEAVLNQ